MGKLDYLSESRAPTENNARPGIRQGRTNFVQ